MLLASGKVDTLPQPPHAGKETNRPNGSEDTNKEVKPKPAPKQQTLSKKLVSKANVIGTKVTDLKCNRAMVENANLCLRWKHE